MISSDQLFNKSRFSSNNAFLPIILLIYSPIGICLLLLRILMSFQYILLFSLLPKHWIIRRILMRVYLFFMGILITSSGYCYKSKNASVVVSNHISKIDAIIIEAIIPSYREDDKRYIPKLVSTIMGWNQENGSLPSSFFPENDSTNGNGMLKFSKKIFENEKFNNGNIIQPVVLMANRSWITPVHISTLLSTFWWDLFWCLFLPFTQFHLNYLPCKTYESDENFISTLQKEMAFVLNVDISSMTAEDKSEYIKRVERDLQQESLRAARMIENNSTHSRSSSQRQFMKRTKMIDQVKAVLPQVPLAIINKEIGRTNNVDQTISDLLDGSVEFSPLSEEQQKKESEVLKSTITKKQEQKKEMSSSTSIKLSFSEKKKIMIADARRKYLEKHPEYS